MAETLVTKSADVSVDATTGMLAPQISGKVARELIPSPGVPLYMASDGKLGIASGAAADAKANIVGFSTRRAPIGQPAVPYGVGAVIHYSDGNLTPGQILYLGTGGTLSSTASVGDTVGIAQAIDEYNIRVTRAI